MSYTDLTQNQCQDVADEAAFITCIVDNNTQDPAGRDCTGTTVTLP